MVRVASATGDTVAVRPALGVFVTSVERGRGAPPLARMIVGNIPASPTLTARLDELDAGLVASDSLADVLVVILEVPDSLGPVRGSRPWLRGHRLLRTFLGPRLCRATEMPEPGFDFLRDRLSAERIALLANSDTVEAADVQLMGPHQSKGRDADATIVVLRGNDYFGDEAEPMPHGSKLLYIVLTRARRKTIILALGLALKPLVSPIARL